MKTIRIGEVHERLLKIQNGLAHQKTTQGRRRYTWKHDLHSIGDDCFGRDIESLLLSKALRRLEWKNQVASSFTTNPNIRTRGTHVKEVVAISMRIARYLGLNVSLAHAIALGHDIGHVPFGHQGEHFLVERLEKKFSHEVFGVVVAQKLERLSQRDNRFGLNLTWETLDGMMRHSGRNFSEIMTPEAKIVRYSDKIAYLLADYNDFIRMGWDCSRKVTTIVNWFGRNQRDRTMRIILALCKESVNVGKVSFEDTEPAKRFAELRTEMLKEYPRIVEQDVGRFLGPIYDFLENTNKIPGWLGIALLTDTEVCGLMSHPGMLNWNSIRQTGLGEFLKNQTPEQLASIDPLDPNLNW